MRWHELVHASLLARSGMARMALNFCAHLGLSLLISRQAHIMCTKLKEIKWSLNWIVSLIGLLPASSFLWSWKELQNLGLSSLCYREANMFLVATRSHSSSKVQVFCLFELRTSSASTCTSLEAWATNALAETLVLRRFQFFPCFFF